MIHPSYVELMDVVNHEVEKTGEDPVVNSRYSIVTATAKRARQLIAGDEPLDPFEKKVKPLSIAVDELYNGELKILTDDEVVAGEEQKKIWEAEMARLQAEREALEAAERAKERAEAAAKAEEEPEEADGTDAEAATDDADAAAGDTYAFDDELPEVPDNADEADEADDVAAEPDTEVA